MTVCASGAYRAIDAHHAPCVCGKPVKSEVSIEHRIRPAQPMNVKCLEGPYLAAMGI
jgi:hypothetical protein